MLENVGNTEAIILRAAEGSPRQLARTQMVRTELAKTRPRAGEADITRQVEKITFHLASNKVR